MCPEAGQGVLAAVCMTNSMQQPNSKAEEGEQDGEMREERASLYAELLPN